MKFFCSIKRTVLIFPILLLLSCQSTPLSEPNTDWADVTFRSVGIGKMEKGWSITKRIQAIQKAKVDAYTQLESKIMRLKIDSKRTISKLSKEDVLFRKKISAFVRGAKVIHTENNEEGIKVIVELFLGDDFKTTVGLSKKNSSGSSNTRRGADFSP
ncbi:MAG: hypothetical protein ACE5FY_04300 [Nitrospiria bacterium]